jgi:hypothetical protein
MSHITKDIFLNTMFCPTYGWRLRNRKIAREFSTGELFRMEQGKTVGKMARELYPEGIFIKELDQREGATVAKNYLEQPGERVLFEAPFISGNFYARADIAIKNEESWDLIEVKSSSKAKPEFIDDMAYTTLVANLSGLTPKNIHLMILDKNFRLGMELEQLFQIIDQTSEVSEKVREFTGKIAEVERGTGSSTEPEPVLKYNCKGCDQFEICFGGACDAHIFCIPRITQPKIDQLLSSGITSIHDIPETLTLSPTQKKFVQCVKCGSIEIDDVIHDRVREIQWPVYYLDFETMMTAVPIYPDIGPYEQIPTQYSIHVCDRMGNVLHHREFIASPFHDSRRHLAENLIRDLENAGSILTYSSFERNIIASLKRMFPDLSEDLQSVLDRLVDLEKCIQCIHHPEFRGRTSIKVVGPVLVPDFSYDSLEIADGDTAMVIFTLAALGMMDEEEWEQKRAALLEYCKMDTYAMVRLHETVHRMIDHEDDSRE